MTPTANALVRSLRSREGRSLPCCSAFRVPPSAFIASSFSHPPIARRPTVALDRRRPADATPRAERHQRQRVTDHEHALQQQLLDPQPRDPRFARGGEPRVQLRDLARRNSRGYADQRRGGGIEPRHLPFPHCTAPPFPRPHPFIALLLLLPAARPPSRRGCSRWVEP